MRIFVTGATGVIGRRVVPLLLRGGHSVSALARSVEKRAELARAGANPIDLDLFAPDAVRRAVDGHDSVINLATHLPAGLRVFVPGAWAENDRIRSVASGHLVAAALAGGAERFIQESFAPVYPDCGELDRRAHADRAGALQSHGRGCRTIGAAVLRQRP